MKVRFLGHGCVWAEIGDSKILIDPFITPNEKAADIKVDQLQPDYIFLTHGHEDHVADAEAIAKQSNAKIVAAFEITSWYETKGCTNVHPMNIGGSWSFDFGKVKMVTAVHSSVLPDGTYGGNPAGFLFETKEGNFYFAGDTALTFDMKLIPTWCKLDFAVLPVGDNFTMGVEDAAVCANWVEAKKVIGVHFDTFGFIEIDHEQAQDTFKQKGVDLHLLKIGETIDI